MRAISIFFLLGLMSLDCPGQDDGGQLNVRIHYAADDYLLKIAKEYFRSDPYQADFGSFLRHLIDDPTLTNKTIHKKTDSTFFFFQGTYKNYSPFGFLANRTEIRFAEKEFTTDDTSSLKDTLFVYQIIGYSYNGPPGMEAVKKEFSKFNRRFGKHFTRQSSDLQKGTEVVGTSVDYFVPALTTPPMTVAWLKLDEFQSAFVLTLRLRMY